MLNGFLARAAAATTGASVAAQSPSISPLQRSAAASRATNAPISPTTALPARAFASIGFTLPRIRTDCDDVGGASGLVSRAPPPRHRRTSPTASLSRGSTYAARAKSSSTVGVPGSRVSASNAAESMASVASTVATSPSAGNVRPSSSGANARSSAQSAASSAYVAPSSFGATSRSSCRKTKRTSSNSVCPMRWMRAFNAAGRPANCASTTRWTLS